MNILEAQEILSGKKSVRPFSLPPVGAAPLIAPAGPATAPAAASAPVIPFAPAQAATAIQSQQKNSVLEKDGFIAATVEQIKRSIESNSAQKRIGRAAVGMGESLGTVAEIPRGVANIAKSTVGMVTGTPLRPLDDEKQKKLDAEVAAELARQFRYAKNPIIDKDSGFFKRGWFGGVGSIAGWIANLAGGLDEAISGAVAGAAGGAAIGGTITAPAGGIGALPSAVVGATKGFSAGLTAGSAKEWYFQGQGESYLEMVKAGIDKDAARTVSAVMAVPYAGIEYLFNKIPGVGAVFDVGAKKTAQVAARGGMKNAAKAAFLSTLFNTPGEASEEALQSANNDIAFNLAAKINAANGGDEVAKKQVGEIVDNAWINFRESILPSMMMIGGGAVASIPGTIRPVPADPNAPPVNPLLNPEAAQGPSVFDAPIGTAPAAPDAATANQQPVNPLLATNQPTTNAEDAEAVRKAMASRGEAYAGFRAVEPPPSAAVGAVKEVSDKMGVKVIWIDGAPVGGRAIQGAAIPGENTILLHTDLLTNPKRDPVMMVYAHELTHRSEKASPKEYGILRDSVLARPEAAASVEEKVAAGMSRAAAESEAVAEQVEVLGTDQAFWTEIFQGKEQSFIEHIIQIVTEMAERVFGTNQAAKAEQIRGAAVAAFQALQAKNQAQATSQINVQGQAATINQQEAANGLQEGQAQEVAQAIEPMAADVAKAPAAKPAPEEKPAALEAARSPIEQAQAAVDAVPPKADGSVDLEERQRVLDEWKADPANAAVAMGLDYGVEIRVGEHGVGGESTGGRATVGSDTTPVRPFAADWTKRDAADFQTSREYPQNQATAAHEIVHSLFSRNPQTAHAALESLISQGVPRDQAFESLVDLGGLYLLEPRAITDAAQRRIIGDWLDAHIRTALDQPPLTLRPDGTLAGAAPPDAPRPAADLAKPVAAHAKGAVVEAMRGLAELVKADPSKPGSGPVMFDEKNYAKAKVHFQKAWVEAKAAGNSIKEFSDYVVAQLGDAIRPFLARFVEEVERSEEWGDKVADARQVDPNTGLRVTAPMKAVGDQEREGFGVKPREPVFTREWDDAVISEARSQISSADKIIAESRKGQRAVTDTDIATMLIAKTERINARVEAANAMKANPDDPAAQKAFTQAQERLTEVYEAIEKAGTTSARALAAMKMTMDERYGVVENMEWELRAAKGGKEVTPAERTNLERIQQQYVREKAQYEKQVALAKEQYADLEERLGTLEAQIFYDRDIPRLDPATLEKMAEGGRLYSLGLDPDRVTSIAKWMLGKMAKGIKNPSELALKHLGEEARPTINAARAKAAEMVAKAGKGASKQRTGKPKGKPTPASEIRDLYRAQIEAGVRDVNEATRNVTAEWNKAHGADAQMTEKQIRDTFSDYGKVIPLTKDEIKRALSELRREAQLTSSIERAMNGLYPLKTGRQRFPPTSEARQMLKTLNNLLKEKGLSAVDPERQLKSAMDARKSRMRNAIEDKKRAIETLQRLAPNKKPPELDAEGQRLKAELDRITEEYNKVFPKEKRSLTDQERLAIATRAAERSLRDVVKELKAARDGVFVFKKKYPGLPHNEYLAGLRAQKRVAQQEILELKELANPGQMAIKKRMRQIESAIKQYKQKLLTGDFTPRKPMEVDISNNPMAMLEKANLEVLKSQYARMKENARFAALPIEKKVAEKMLSGAVGGYNFFRNIKSSWDNSGALRQGKMLAYSNPIIWVNSLKDGYKVYFSRDASISYWEEFKNRPNFDLYKKSGLAIGEGNGRGDFGPIDDLIRPDLAQSIPLVGRHMRQFTVTLNNFRANLFDKLIANASEKLSDEDLKSYASFVNTWTGRGELGVGKYKLKAEGIAQILWAPRFISSSFINALRPLTLPFEYALYGIKIGPSHIRGLLGKSPAARAELRNVVTTQYLRAIGSLAAIYATGYALNILFGDDGDEYVEKNLTSSDFGNINIPGTDMVINPLNDMKPALVFAARFLAGYQKTRTGERRKLTWWGGKDTVTSNVERTGWAGTWDDFWKTKGHPAIGSMKQITTYKDFIGGDIYPWFAWVTALSPIVPQSYVQMFRTEVGPTLDSIDLTHLPEFAVLAALAYVGVQPRQRDYKTPRYMKVNLKKEDYEKKRTSAIMAGTSYEIVNGGVSTTASPEARAYLEQFLEEDGADALRAALKAEFSERRKAQKDRAGRMRTDDAESKRLLQLNRLIRAYEKEQKKQEEYKRRRDLERAAQKGQIA